MRRSYGGKASYLQYVWVTYPPHSIFYCYNFIIVIILNSGHKLGWGLDPQRMIFSEQEKF